MKFEFLMKAAITTSALVATILVTGYTDTHYVLKATVDRVEGNEVVAKDARENYWSFIGDGFEQGQDLLLTMYTKETDNVIEDDEVVNVKCVKH